MAADEGLTRIVRGNLDIAVDSAAGNNQRRLIPALLSGAISSYDPQKLGKIGRLKGDWRHRDFARSGAGRKVIGQNDWIRVEIKVGALWRKEDALGGDVWIVRHIPAQNQFLAGFGNKFRWPDNGGNAIPAETEKEPCLRTGGLLAMFGGVVRKGWKSTAPVMRSPIPPGFIGVVGPVGSPQ